VFLDDHTHILNLQLLASKDQALKAWWATRACWENLSDQQVKAFCSDNGGEFMSDAFSRILKEAEIECQFSAPYAHQQNGKAEQVMWTIKGWMYAMLDHAHLPCSLWGEAALTEAYLFNRSESRALPPGIMPYEILHGTQPTLTHPHIFSAHCFACIPPELQEKLGPRSCEALFMGYPPGVKGWCCCNVATAVFFNSHNVIFNENFTQWPFPDSDDEDDDLVMAPVCNRPVTAPLTPIPPSAPIPPHADIIRHSGCIPVPTVKGTLFKEQIATDKQHLKQQHIIHAARIQGVPPPSDLSDHSLSPSIPDEPAILPGPSVFDPADLDAIMEDDKEVEFPHVLANLIAVEFACLSICSDVRHNPLACNYNLWISPATYDEAAWRPDCDDWWKEINLMLKMNVYELVPLPAEHHAIGCHWVLEFKEDLKGSPLFEACLVAQGFSQITGVDFSRTFTPVAKSTSIHILAAHDWELDCFDVKWAFLWGKLQEDIYMWQPPGFEQQGPNAQHLICHLLSSLCGLKQAAFYWYELLCDILTCLGFLCCDADYAVFIFDHVNSEGARVICIIAWHVNDSLAGSNNQVFLDQIKGQIAECFSIADLGAVSKYLGIQFICDRQTHELWMHQEDYIHYLLNEHSMSECNPVALPMDPNFPFGHPTNVYPNVNDLEMKYWKLMGELLYLAMYIHPDIAFAVMWLAQHNASAKPCHYSATKPKLCHSYISQNLCGLEVVLPLLFFCLAPG
jgi:hypothetical protein